MKSSILIWVAGGVVSLAFHVGLGTLIEFSIDPDPVEMQDVPEARLEMTAYEVQRTEIREGQVEGEPAKPGEARQTSLSQDAIPRVVAAVQKPQSAPVSAASLVTESLKPTNNPAGATVQAASAPQTPVISTARLDTTVVTAAIPQAPLITGGRISTAKIKSAEPNVTAVISAQAAGARLADISVQQSGPLLVASLAPGLRTDAQRLSVNILSDVQPETSNALITIRPDTHQSKPVAPEGVPLNSGNLPSATADTQPAPAEPVREGAPGDLSQDLFPQAPHTEFAVASLAWIGGTKTSFDPASLAAIQSFMTERDLSDASNNAGSVRDGIAAMLSQVPCSRLQVAFVPETGSLELRGHVPEDGLRLPVLAALQAQMGTSIPVIDNLLILPRPQCGALSGIGSVGLPQSTDQLTNPLLVGADAHAKLYSYSRGERLTFDLTAPDYDAYIYVDYFDADGMVIHLVPNDAVTLEHQIAKSIVSIGADRADGNFLAVTIGPPYGQEIAVAFAASEPLFEAVRPTVEPADAYLGWLREQVSLARKTHADFKGEWVYFFISTSQGS